MFYPKELQDIISFAMPAHSRTSQAPQEVPDFTTKCHYTIQIFTCNHKSWLSRPRITHIQPCQYSAPSYPFLSDESPYHAKNASRHRCNNMASRSQEVRVDEQCSKCRPGTLGVEKKLRPFERLIDENGEVKVNNVLKTSNTAEGERSTGEIERELEALTLEETEKISAPEPETTAEHVSEDPEKEPELEQPSDSQIHAEPKVKPQRWVDACPSIDNGKAPLSAQSGKKGLLSRILRPFVKSGDASGPQSEVKGTKLEDAKAEGESAADDMKINEAGKPKDKGWIKVKDDPDWEVVSDKERKEAAEASAGEDNQKS